MKKLLTIITALFLFATIGAAQTNGKLLITAKLGGDQEVPAVTTNAKGVAGFLLNETRDSLFINITVANLSGPIMGVHIHEGAKGTNGGVKTNLTTNVNGNLVSTVITGSALTAEMMKGLVSGKYYVNVHTAANMDGEIRGQLELETDWGFYGMLEGSQENPSVNSNGQGWVVASLSKNKEMVHVWAVFRNLTGTVTAAHFHNEVAGMNGAVVANLSTNITGNTIQATIPAAAFADALIAGSIYLNVHTDSFPNGELRAQMMWSDAMNFVSYLDGAQEVPATTAVGKGVALFRVNAAMDSLWYDVLIDSLTGALGGAHLHDGAKGATGNVLIDLSSSISGNTISGKTGGLTMANLTKIMKGNVYVNVHTTANMNGEVRGQLMPLARTGYTTRINGMQEVPAVATLAMGTGIVSVDAMQTNAHYMVVVNGLSGSIQSSHFHNAPMGTNGSVVYDLSPSFTKNGTSDGAFGYWTMGLTPALAEAFNNGSIYINIHTTANMNGEIRGQVNSDGFSVPNTTGIYNPSSTQNITVYPNPTVNTINVVLDAEAANNSIIKIIDMQGKVMWQQATGFATNTETAIPVAALQNGVYVLQIETPKGLQIAKFIKQ